MPSIPIHRRLQPAKVISSNTTKQTSDEVRRELLLSKLASFSHPPPRSSTRAVAPQPRSSDLTLSKGEERARKLKTIQERISIAKAKKLESNDSEEEEEDVPNKRALILAKLKAKAAESWKEEQQVVERIKDEHLKEEFNEESNEESKESYEDEDEQTSSSESSSDSSSDDGIPRPVFIPKNQRPDVAKQRAEIAEEERVRLEQEGLRRRQESVVMLGRVIDEEIRKEHAVAAASEESKFGLRPGRPDDTDGLDEEGEYEAWKLRELQRLMREHGL